MIAIGTIGNVAKKDSKISLCGPLRKASVFSAVNFTAKGAEKAYITCFLYAVMEGCSSFNQ
jgi:hypothetical protein